MGILNWFEPVTSSQLLRILIVALLMVLAASAFIAHSPVILPGPLTRSERKSRTRSALARHGSNVIAILLTAAAILGVALLLAPPREPVVLLLSSRLRAPAERAPGLIDTEDDHYARLDIGPVVDAVLRHSSEKGARSWLTSTPSARNALREIVLSTALGVEPVALQPGATPTSGEAGGLPPWLVQNTEVTVVQLLMSRYNAVQVRIAPGPAATPASGWALAATILSGGGKPVRLANPIELREDGFVVRKIARAIVTPLPSPVLRAWVVIDGHFRSPGDATIPLRLIQTRVAETGAEEHPLVSVTVPHDDASTRIVPVELPLIARITPTDTLRLGDEHGRCSTVVRIESTATPPVGLRLTGSEYVHWEKALGDLRASPVFLAVRNELESLGVSTPEATPVGSPGTPVLIAESGVVSISRTEASARDALTHLITLPRSPVPAHARTRRVSLSRSGPSTVFSLMELPLQEPGATTFIPGAPEGSERLAAAASASELLGQGRFSRLDIEKESPYAVQGVFGGEPAILFYGPMGAPPENTNTLLYIAKARALACAVHTIRVGFQAEAAIQADEIEEPLRSPAPVISNSDLQEAIADRLSVRDGCAVGLIGSYLAFLLIGVSRNAPQGR